MNFQQRLASFFVASLVFGNLAVANAADSKVAIEDLSLVEETTVASNEADFSHGGFGGNGGHGGFHGGHQHGGFGGHGGHQHGGFHGGHQHGGFHGGHQHGGHQHGGFHFLSSNNTNAVTLPSPNVNL